jgi:hypothetical protein
MHALMTADQDNLPPVQPPSARFLMQLFVVPLVIVVVIVMVCLMFNWLAHLGSPPQDLVRDLSKLNAGSWQKALTIANMLTDRRSSALRQDREMAGRLAEILSQELDAGDVSPERIKLRVYLCMALGVFEVDEGLFELMDAARLQRDRSEIEVRKSAIEALARRADLSPQRQHQFAENDELLTVLKDAAAPRSDQPDLRELDAQLRLRAAYALGVIGGDSARQTLAGLLIDAEPSVRYNAATGLARHGDARAVPRLVEMLAARSRDSSDPTALDELEATTILQNALRASIQLADANPNLDLTLLHNAIAQLNADERLSNTVRRGIELDIQTALQRFPLESGL